MKDLISHKVTVDRVSLGPSVLFFIVSQDNVRKKSEELERNKTEPEF
jgi:hypothetical protein